MADLKNKKRSSTAAPTPHDWDLEGESSSHPRAASPAPSNTRSAAPNLRHDSQMSEVGGGEGRYSEAIDSDRRIGADNTVPAQETPERIGRSDKVSTKQPSRASSSNSSTRGRVTSSDKKARRPTTSRKGSTLPTHNKPRPEFSVDDNQSEVEEDLHTHKVLSSIHGTTSYTQMRRHSLLRRRGTGGGALSVAEDEHSEHSDSGDNAPQDHDDDQDAGRDRSYAPSEADSVESFTLKDRQQAINETHPFGIRIWKPALYKKLRSVQRTAEGDIHSTPGARIGPLLSLVNILWVIVFGWWLASASFIAGLGCFFFLTPSARAYARVFFGLSWYLFYPFGNFVEFEQEEAYLEEDEGEGRSISEYEQWQAGDLEGGGTFFAPRTPRSIIGRRRESLDSSGETESLLGAQYRRDYSTMDSPVRSPPKRRLFGRGDWSIGRIVFFTWFYLVVAPLLLLVSLICWWLVFTIPMAKVTSHLFSHLRRHPLALSFHSTASARSSSRNPSILLCTYRAVGWKYYKYTIDGTNIFFINHMSVVVFVIIDHYVLAQYIGLKNFFTESATIFFLALSSVIPLAYFIGQAVASISAQSSMGMGATINAFFSTIVEVFLYIVALDEGKGRLVEGSIVGSILAGVLFMPGLSMCSGAIVRKTQRFNARSAGVTSTMLLFAIIGAFAPTLFYQIYGTYELTCSKCNGKETSTDCQRCVFTQVPATTDRFYYDAVLPFTYIAATFLFISYMIGLWFTLRTHAAVIWQTPSADTVPQPLQTAYLLGSVTQRNAREGEAPYQTESLRQGVKDTQLYKRILGQSLSGVGLRQDGAVPSPVTAPTVHPGQPLHVVPPRSSEEAPVQLEAPTPATTGVREPAVTIPGLSSEQNASIVRGVAEVAAAAATAAVQDAQRLHQQQQCLTRKLSVNVNEEPTQVHAAHGNLTLTTDHQIGAAEELGAHGGHDAPNWSKAKSAIILIGATILYAVMAEILVNTVDGILQNFEVDEKFLGITLFALVPNTTEFLNAISFAMNGNIALSMEIGSAYALQVCLLQIPALVAWSAYSVGTFSKDQILTHTFTLIFPQWDLVTVILCVFLLSYMYGEGKSNYFKGSILVLSYLTVMMGFYFSSYADVPLNSKSSNSWRKAGSGSRAGGYMIEI
ncbi:Sodium/calcium exchanger protein-domain-containing protein [Kalaharituber pfeilii]|nr:Sodium/calcium exchanger protein-domain-containing protein [Kalaharituber pfeilii]